MKLNSAVFTTTVFLAQAFYTLSTSHSAHAFTAEELQDIEETSIVLDAATEQDSPAAQPEERKTSAAATTTTSAPRRAMIPVKFIVPFSRVADMKLDVSEQKTSSWGGGIEVGYQFLKRLTQDSDSAFMRYLKSVGLSVDYQYLRGSDAFTRFLRSEQRTSTITYTPEEWQSLNFPRNNYGYNRPRNCDLGVYYCGNQVCCDYSYSVNIYGTPDGSQVAWQRQSIGILLWVPVVELKDRFRVNVGGTARFHDLSRSNNTSTRTSTWRTSHNFAVDSSWRFKGPVSVGGGYEKSYAGFGNRILKAYVEVDFGRLRYW